MAGRITRSQVAAQAALRNQMDERKELDEDDRVPGLPLLNVHAAQMPYALRRYGPVSPGSFSSSPGQRREWNEEHRIVLVSDSPPSGPGVVSPPSGPGYRGMKKKSKKRGSKRRSSKKNKKSKRH